MGKKHSEINDKNRQFIEAQHLFFVATSAPDARINLSPKGGDSLRIIDGNTVAWLNLTGNGNETAAHLQEDDRMTLMLCAFEGRPKILRLYGHARAIHPHDTEWDEMLALFPPHTGARQVMLMRVDLVHTSCGFGVPLYDFVNERSELDDWTDKKSETGIRDYWDTRNAISLDGRSTGIQEK